MEKELVKSNTCEKFQSFWKTALAKAKDLGIQLTNEAVSSNVLEKEQPVPQEEPNLQENSPLCQIAQAIPKATHQSTAKKRTNLAQKENTDPNTNFYETSPCPAITKKELVSISATKRLFYDSSKKILNQPSNSKQKNSGFSARKSLDFVY